MTTAQEMLDMNDPESIVNIVMEQGRAIEELQRNLLELNALGEISLNLGSGVQTDEITAEMIHTKASLVDVEKWLALGLPSDTIGGYVYAIAYDAANNYAYIGGNFAMLGGVFGDHIMRYNLSTREFENVGSLHALNGAVFAIAVSGDFVFVGGNFTNADGIASADYIAKYTISTGLWSSVGGALNNYVNAIAITGDSVFVGGLFLNADGIASADYIVKHTISTGVWSSIGGALNAEVKAIAIANDDIVFVGGLFLSADGITGADYIAMYTISTGLWSSAGGQLGNEVDAIAITGDFVFVGGNFTNADGIASADYIAMYTISTGAWSGIGGDLDAMVTALAIVGDTLFVGGSFTAVDDIDNTLGIATYKISDAKWGYTATLDSNVLALCACEDNVIAGGTFAELNFASARMIVMFHKRLDSVLETFDVQIGALQDNLLLEEQARVGHISDFANPHGTSDANIQTTDITTNDASTTKHGFAPKATAPGSGLLSVLGIGNGETVRSDKALFDTTDPAALGTAAPGTQVKAARRDHVHQTPTAAGVGAPDVSSSSGSIADDGVFSFTPRANTGIIIAASLGSGIAASEYIMAVYSTVAPYMTAMSIGSNTDASTGAKTGTTGTDTRCTISAHTDGKIYIENRRGGARTWRIQVFTL